MHISSYVYNEMRGKDHAIVGGKTEGGDTETDIREVRPVGGRRGDRV